jgi:hypothetical protein
MDGFLSLDVTLVVKSQYPWYTQTRTVGVFVNKISNRANLIS